MWLRGVILALLCCLTAADAVPGRVPRDGTIHNDIIEPGKRSSHVMTKTAKQRQLFIEISSNNRNATVHVNGRLTWWHSVDSRDHPSTNDPNNVQGRGLFLVVVHPITGRLQGQALASGWMVMDTGHAMRRLVRNSRQRDVLLFFTVGEIGPGLVSNEEAVAFMDRMGASYFRQRHEADMYALARVKGGAVLAETYVQNPVLIFHESNQHKKPLLFALTVPVPAIQDILCPWFKTPKNLARAKFCFKYDGYGDLCQCKNDAFLPLKREQLANNNLTDVPIAVVASNRPQALFRSMNSLLRNRGIIPSNVVVFVDGEHREVDDLCALLDIKCISQTSDHEDVTLRIREHYHMILSGVWRHFPDASRVIVLEEDLDVSPDFVSFFSQTSHLLDVDPSLWCVSAWNDHGYDITKSEPALLYRIEYMPGLGWMMKKSVIQELLDKWPAIGQAYDWDVWLRWGSNRKDRECIIPDISRTYHFGISGSHSTSNFHSQFYTDHIINTQPDVVLSHVEDMVEDRYEMEIIRLIGEAKAISPEEFKISGGGPAEGGSCDLELDGEGNTYALFFAMNTSEDTEMYKTLAKCMEIWDLDARGDHRGLWRFTYDGNNILMFGVPITKYMTDVLRVFKHPVTVIQTLIVNE